MAVEVEFVKFTERARRVLTLAQEEARRFNHSYIGTEHILLGLVRVGDCSAAKVLSNLGVEPKQVGSAVEAATGPGGEQAGPREVGLTPRAKKVIELAVDEARLLSHSNIGTEHILLGLVREGEGIAASVLESMGGDLQCVRAETVRVLAQASAQPQEPSGETPKRATDQPEVARILSATTRGELTLLVSDATVLDVAINAVQEAREALSKFAGRDLEREFVSEYILRSLDFALATLSLKSTVPEELLLARERLREASSAIDRARSVFEKAGERAVAGVLENAAFQLAAAVP